MDITHGSDLKSQLGLAVAEKPWLAREARHGVSISMITKELRGNIESVL